MGTTPLKLKSLYGRSLRIYTSGFCIYILLPVVSWWTSITPNRPYRWSSYLLTSNQYVTLWHTVTLACLVLMHVFVLQVFFFSLCSDMCYTQVDMLRVFIRFDKMTSPYSPQGPTTSTRQRIDPRLIYPQKFLSNSTCE